jgi:hypothetical protein
MATSIVVRSLLILSVLFLAAEGAINPQGDMFLRSNFAEIGISAQGFQNSDFAAPAGFHPQDPSNRLGLVFDRFQDDDWSTFVGDFSTLGSSEQLFGLSGATSGFSAVNGASAPNDITTTVSNNEVDADRVGEWVGEVAMLGTTLRVTKRWDGKYADDNGFFVTVTVTNIGLSPTNEEVLYFEAMNPANDASLLGGDSTFNSVTSQGSFTSDGVPYYQVTARGSVSGADTAVFYTSYDTRSFVSSDAGSIPWSALDVLGGGTSDVTGDVSIAITANLGIIPILGSKNYQFYIGLGVPPTETICSNTPRLKCTTSVSINTAPNACSAALHYQVPSYGTCATGFLPLPTLSLLGLDSIQNVGTYGISFNGFGQSCDISVTISDNTPPTLTCPPSIPLSPAPGSCTLATPDISSLVSSSDACGIDPSLTLLTGVGATLSLGTFTVSLSMTDIHGNSASCQTDLVVTVGGSFSCDSDSDGINDDVEGTNDPDGDNIPNYLDTDSDGDNIDDIVEGTNDPDGDNIPNYLDTDSDGDTINDIIEGINDPDGDNIPNYLDLDSDGDNIGDIVEGINDPDGDNIPNYLDLDSDGDNINDIVEGINDPDGDNIPNYLDLDSDGDNINDIVEGINDPDGDNIPNYLDLDSDGDNINDIVEGINDPDGDNIPNYLDTDSDGDNINDIVEGINDPDGDNIPNYLDTDSDGDNIDDSVEGINDPDGDNIPNYLDTDSDGDNIDDIIEGINDPDGDNIPNYLDTDSDGDNISDIVEGTNDPDGDNIPNYLDTDSDGDLISDIVEGITDSDGDNIPNYLDLDSDGDTINDIVEGSNDPDGDNIPNFLDLDSDGDLISDIVEGITDSDGDNIPNYLDTDSDNDGIPDKTEGTNDPDGDLIPNYLDLDSDGDTIDDIIEGSNDPDGDNIPNFLDLDSDGDNISDIVEGITDSDGDNIPNFLDTDSDNDGIPDKTEGTNDPDGDLIPNYLDGDCDNDGISDAVETSLDRDGDLIPNYLDLDSDNDGILDSIEKSIDTDGDLAPNFLDLDSDNDGVPDTVESGYLAHTKRDNYKTIDSDKDGVVDEVDSMPFVWGSSMTFTLYNSDSDLAPNYLDLDSDNNGVFDLTQKAFLGASFDGDNNGMVDGPDSDGDGIVNRVDGCTCFGGMTTRNFDFVLPVSKTVWKMYLAAKIQWSHNLSPEFSKIKIELMSASGGSRVTILDRDTIGPSNKSVQSRSWSPSRINPGKMVLKVGVYVGTTFHPDLFTSEQFTLSV